MSDEMDNVPLEDYSKWPQFRCIPDPAPEELVERCARAGFERWHPGPPRAWSDTTQAYREGWAAVARAVLAEARRDAPAGDDARRAADELSVLGQEMDLDRAAQQEAADEGENDGKPT